MEQVEVGGDSTPPSAHHAEEIGEEERDTSPSPQTRQQTTDGRVPYTWLRKLKGVGGVTRKVELPGVDALTGESRSPKWT